MSTTETTGDYQDSGKSQHVAALLAWLLGGFGAHKFYIGQRKTGKRYLLFFWTFIPACYGLAHAFHYSTMDEEEFHRRITMEEAEFETWAEEGSGNHDDTAIFEGKEQDSKTQTETKEKTKDIQYLSDKSPATKNRNKDGNGDVFEINANVCIYPKNLGGKNKQEYQSIVNKSGESKEIETTNWGVKTEETKFHEYEHTNISQVNFSKNGIEILNQDIDINYSDILNVELLQGKLIGSVMLLHDSTYLRLVVDYASEENQENRELYYIYLIGQHQGDTDLAKAVTTSIEKEVVKEPNVSIEEFEEAESFLNRKCDNLEQNMDVLIDWIEWDGMLRIQGVQEGSKSITGSISGKTQSTGVSRGVEVGPFSKSRSESKGSVEADVDGKISDNTFESDINFFQVDDNGIYIRSDPILDLPYSEIDRVHERKKGFLVEIGSTTYSLTGRSIFVNGRVRPKSLDRDINSTYSFIQQQIKDSQNNESDGQPRDGGDSNQTAAEKMQDLKQLYDDGIISDDEFESKKEELLDEF